MTEPERYQEMLRRIDALEKQQEKVTARMASLETGQALTSEILRSIKADLSEIKSDGVWLRRIILGALASAIVAFIAGGGLTLP